MSVEIAGESIVFADRLPAADASPPRAAGRSLCRDTAEALIMRG
jgi:hypothetical protein